MLTPDHRDRGMVQFNRAGWQKPAGPFLEAKPPNVVFVDCDGTLICSGARNDRLVAELERLKSEGKTIALWSARGEDYARKIAEQFGIVHLFKFITSKPGTIYDDRGWDWVKHTKVVRGL